MKKLVLLFLASLLIATVIFYYNSNVIINGWGDKFFEVLFITLPVFILLSLAYYINRALVRSVKNLKNKKPSIKEGL